MKTQAHTIAPWEATQGTTTSKMVIAPNATSKLKSCVARLGGPDAEANARLIAAAPELLKALEYVRRFVKKEDVDTDYLDAIIAKAKGE